MDVETFRTVEVLASRAWPALEVLEVDGWRLRWAAGFSRRANSVWPAAFTPPPEGKLGSLDDRLDLVEVLYRQRGLRPRYQLSRTSRPRGLAGALQARGYRREMDTSIETVSLWQLAEGLRACPLGRLTVRGDHVPDEDWWSVWRHVEAASETEQATAAAILERVPAPSLYAVARVGDRPVGIGRAVLDGEWLGLLSMATLPHHRRLGAARGIMRWLSMWGESGGASRAYLQVETLNKPGRRLYADAGFRPLGRYTYWSAPATAARKAPRAATAAGRPLSGRRRA